ncbi:Pantothenate transporter liz1 protein [Rutstroemia sp. NJR-2017a BVV2]|nr:Pantothenate transporter liz1 protein [Rutstroemia sp. NJR-2017a BVV2]PQE21700.1 Pantothenate transporter liz1 protein [Rutstroemia sp. NJR-2017a BVV2]
MSYPAAIEKDLQPEILPAQTDSSSADTAPRTAPSDPSSKREESKLRAFQRYIWDDPNKPHPEKRFLLKLDLFLLSYTCLGYFCKNLDQSNLSNAYVSGMREALSMHGSQLTYLSNVFTAGYVLSQIPAVILVTRIRPSLLIPTLEVLWSVLTFCSAAATSVAHLYAIRFLIGLCEGAFFPCIVYVIGGWYTRVERAKRMTLFYCTATLAAMFSGYLQAAAYDNLDGKMGRAGWQWLFIICGTISLPVGVMGYFFNPDFPETTRAFYLSGAEIELAKERLKRDGYTALGASKWDRGKIVRLAGKWQFWVLPLGYFFIQAALPSQQPVFALWLKAKGNSVYDRNVLPTGQYAVGVVVQVLAAMLSDSPLFGGARWHVIVLMQLGTLFSCIVLAVWTVPVKLKFVAFYLSYFAAGVPALWFAWYPDLMPADHEMRGFVIASSNVCGYVNQIWYSDAVWRTEEAPRFRQGWIAAGVFGGAVMGVVILCRVLEGRDGKRRGVGEGTGRRDEEDYQVGGVGRL